MMEQVLKFIRQQKLIEEGDHVVAGVSGGADSVCLLFVLLQYKKEVDFQISVVHVHHNLRGEEADRDADYVRELCSRHQLPFSLILVDVKKLAAEKKISLEEAGRLARYEAFERFCIENGGTKIALAHHQNDLAETMIYHLARGTGMKGLTGISPRRGKIIRPLLGMKRQEIEHYLYKNNIKYLIDSSNMEDEYARNRIRHHVVEYLEKEINAQVVSHMAETAADAAEIQLYLEQQAGRLYKQYVTEEDGCTRIALSLFSQEFPAFLQNLVIRMCIEALTGSLKDITRIHLNDVRVLGEKQVGKAVNLPDGLIAKRAYDAVRISMEKCGTGSKKGGIFCELEVPGIHSMGKMQIFCTLEQNNHQIIPEKSYTKWLNYDRIKGTLVLRSRKPGDYLVVNQNGGKKKLKDYLIDQKVPKEKRDQIPLLCAGSEVLWVCGHRISEAYKVSEKTEMILKVQIQGGTIHE